MRLSLYGRAWFICLWIIVSIRIWKFNLLCACTIRAGNTGGFTLCMHNSGGQHRRHTPSIHNGTQHANSARVTHAATMTLVAPEEGGEEEVPAGATFDFRLLQQSKAVDSIMYDRFYAYS